MKSELVSRATSISELPARAPARSLSGVPTAVELLLVYAGILQYLWRWQFGHPLACVPLLAVVLLSHLAHRDRLSDLGVTLTGLRRNAEFVLPIMLLLLVPLLIYGFARHLLAPARLGKYAIATFAAYAVWCAVQQYLLQSYFHNRLMSLFESRHRSSLVAAVMFGAAHIPNLILVIATTLAGFIFAEAFARHRNIWPPALAQAVGGFLLAALSPPSLIHNMRVGPGYYFYGLR